jgi:hypothetical protein
MENIARWFVIGGLIMILIGGGVYVLSKLGIPLGHLPGDIYIKGENGTFYFPIMTCVVVSIVLTVVLNVVVRLLRK